MENSERASEPDYVRTLIGERMRQMRMSMKDLSKHCGKNNAYVFQFLNTGSPKVLPEDVRNRMAEALELPPDMLRHNAPPSIRRQQELASIAKSNTTSIYSSTEVPVYRVGFPVDALRADEWATWPILPSSAAPTGAFAVWVGGDSSRLRTGDLAFVHPTRPARRGDIVVVISDQTLSAIGELTEISSTSATVDGEIFPRPQAAILKICSLTLA